MPPFRAASADQARCATAAVLGGRARAPALPSAVGYDALSRPRRRGLPVSRTWRVSRSRRYGLARPRGRLGG